MFITDLNHEFFPTASFGASNSRRWRIVSLSLHAPWFVLTVEVPDGQVRLARTACIAWDTDLVNVLESLGDARAAGLLCMIPGRCSPTGQWSARAIREVWVASTSGGSHVVILRDEYGNEFGDQTDSTQLQMLGDRRLILRLEGNSGHRTRRSPRDPSVGEPRQDPRGQEQ